MATVFVGLNQKAWTIKKIRKLRKSISYVNPAFQKIFLNRAMYLIYQTAISVYQTLFPSNRVAATERVMLGTQLAWNIFGAIQQIPDKIFSQWRGNGGMEEGTRVTARRASAALRSLGHRQSWTRKHGMTWNKDANMTPTTGGTTGPRRRRRRRRASDLEYSVADVSYCSPTGTSLCHHHSPSRRPIPLTGGARLDITHPVQRGIGATTMPGSSLTDSLSDKAKQYLSWSRGPWPSWIGVPVPPTAPSPVDVMALSA